MTKRQPKIESCNDAFDSYCRRHGITYAQFLEDIYEVWMAAWVASLEWQRYNKRDKKEEK